jgi:hypothetical protein
VVTNTTLAKALCVTCLLACVVQVWSTETVADGEVKVKEDVPCRWTEGVKDGRESWTEGPGDWVASHGG